MPKQEQSNYFLNCILITFKYYDSFNIPDFFDSNESTFSLANFSKFKKICQAFTESYVVFSRISMEDFHARLRLTTAENTLTPVALSDKASRRRGHKLIDINMNGTSCQHCYCMKEICLHVHLHDH